MACGACCGLYNRPDTSRRFLFGTLASRTLRFAKVPRTAEAIDAFRVQEEHLEAEPGPYPDFHRCPFLGLVGKKRMRVGCLLHPLSEGNQGVDLRGLSFYGGLACRDYFCPSHQSLSSREKKIVKATCRNWHLYGLVITDAGFVSSVFSEVELRTGTTLDEKGILENPSALSALTAVFNLKVHWPFRAPGWKGPGTYFFNDAAYPPIPINYEKLGRFSSRFNALLESLGSAFDTSEALGAAEEILERAFGRLERSLGAPGFRGVSR